MLADLSVRGILDAFASSEPTPGGGSAAALAGALGASLLAMVAGLPKTKSGTPEDRATLDAARARLMALRDSLIGLIDRDAEAYDLVVAAYKRPKDSDADKAARKAAIQEALRVATMVPLETFKACVEGMAAAGIVAERGNPSAISDVIVGFSALGLGLQGAGVNVEINLGSISDPAVVESVTQELRAATKRTTEVGRQVYGNESARDLLNKLALRSGHHKPPDRGTREFTEMIANTAAQCLAQLESPEARQALQALAASEDPVVAQRAREALEKLQ